MKRTAWTIVGLSLLLLVGCSRGVGQAPPPLPPAAPEPQGVPVMDATTTATIYLRGLPQEMISLEDDQGQTWLVVSSGLENVGLGTHVLLEGGAGRPAASGSGQVVRPEAIASYRWTLEGPPGSAATLNDPTSRTPIFVPDLAGLYRVGLTVANSGGVVSQPATMTIHGGTWVGNGSIPGASDDPHQCTECHADKLETWQGTRHAVTLQRAMDGQASPFYFENCIHCHTVGKNPVADNGGFDDLARQLNWSYPTELVPGNYNRLVSQYPRLANLGNTQCETCHGPGSDHGGDDAYIAVGLRPELCIQCHDFLQQDRHAQWARSGHYDTSLPQLFPDGIDNPVCSGCHTTRGFVATVDGLEVIPGDREQLTCQACHDPHAAPGANHDQLRYFGSIRLPDGTNVANAGPSALCIHCHNAGATVEWVNQEPDPLKPPPQSAAPEMLARVAGYTYGEALDDSPHSSAAQWSDGCVGCHMASSTGTDSGDFLSSTMNEPVGEHTFLVRWDNDTPADESDDFQNVRACDGCHGEIPRLNGPAGADYDGDGEIQGVQDEVQGLLDLVRSEISARGVAWSDTAPYWGPAEGVELRAVVYNWSVVNNDGSRGIHNTARSVELLQLTYRKLTGREVRGATLRAGNPPPTTLQERFAAERRGPGGFIWAGVVAVLAALAWAAPRVTRSSRPPAGR